MALDECVLFFNMHPVFALDAVEALNFSGPTPYWGVLGHPVEHSLSPQMHCAALNSMAAEHPCWASGRYIKIDVAPKRLQQSLQLLWRKGFQGLNLTVPHKVLAMDLIDFVDAHAARLGSVNTLLRTPRGYSGFNTDGPGLLNALAQDLSIGPDFGAWPVVLIGAGGAARAAAVSLLDAGCPYMVVFNRSAEPLAAMRIHLEKLGYGSTRVAMRLLAQGLPKSLPPRGLAVQATSLGLKKPDSFVLHPSVFPKDWRLYDMAYVYGQPTSWIRQAQYLGYKAADGLGMLLHQGALALQIWAECDPPLEVMRQALQQAAGRA